MLLSIQTIRYKKKKKSKWKLGLMVTSVKKKNGKNTHVTNTIGINGKILSDIYSYEYAADLYLPMHGLESLDKKKP